MNQWIHIFCGPSLPPSLQPILPEVVFHPPVSQGEVFALVERKPFAIGLIDGYFEQRPAVWHKELLWALFNGVHIFGAASLGALRAVELADFGMIGVGHVFDEFCSGRLTDDDEVAITHASAEWDYRPGSLALVNLRETLKDATAHGILPEPVAQQIAQGLKATFYPDRSFAQVVSLARAHLNACEQTLFENWLRQPGQLRDVKRQDALLLLEAVTQLRTKSPTAFKADWHFEYTEAWAQVRHNFERRGPLSDTQGGCEQPKHDLSPTGA